MVSNKCSFISRDIFFLFDIPTLIGYAHQMIQVNIMVFYLTIFQGALTIR